MIQITPPQNPQYWINQRALTFSENDLENVNRIAVSLVSGTVIMVYEKGVIDYAPDGNFQKWTLKGYSTRLVSPLVHHIYARLSRTEKDALIVFSINNYNIDGSITTIVTDENGNPVLDEDGKEQTTTSEPNPNYWYVKIGEITATNGTSNRELTYDSGALGTSKGVEESAGWNEMFELSKQSTPWLIFVKQMFYEFTVKNPITLLGGLIFKNKNGVERKITDIKRSTDSDHEYVLDDSGNPTVDEEGNLIKNPSYVPVNDETIPTTAYLDKHCSARFLRKDTDDRSSGMVSSDKGFEAGRYVSGVSGAIMFIDKITGKSVAEVDKLYVRMKAYFETLEIKNANSIGGKQIISPAGGVRLTDVAYGEYLYDEEGNLVLDENEEPIFVEYDGFVRCYFLAEQDGEKIGNRFKVGDQMYCQFFNAFEGEGNKISNKYYWRLLVATDNNTVIRNGKECYYFDLSKDICDTDSDMPEVGDVVCHRGSMNDVDRQNFLEFSSVDAFSPSITLFQGVGGKLVDGEWVADYSLIDKEMVQFAVNKSTGRAFMHLYGDMYVGDRLVTNEDGTTIEPKSYIRYTQENGLEVKGKISASSTIGDTNTTFGDFVTNIHGDIDNLQQQIDGAIESFFYEEEPTLENVPAKDWDTEDEKKAHLNDTYTDLTSGRSWRWSVKDGVYGWVEITDTATAEALRLAGLAKDTADGKRRVFTKQPTPPYDEGDLWSRGKDYSLKICVNSKPEGGLFEQSDWDDADNVNKVKEELEKAKEELDQAIKDNAEDLNKLNQSLNDTKTYIDGAFADGIITETEKVAIEKYIKQIETVKAETDASYEEVYGNELLLETSESGTTADSTVKIQLKSAYETLGASIVDLITTIQSVILDDKATSDEIASVDFKYDTFNSKYGDYIKCLNAAINYIELKLNSKISQNIADLGGYAYLKEALKDGAKTEINGGLVQSTLLALGEYSDDGKSFTVWSGTSGIYDETKIGNGIAAWYGGGNIDLFQYYDSTNKVFNVPDGVRAAMGVDRMDGTGYRANGNLWWDENGVVHADPLSFFVGESTVGGLLASFQVVLQADGVHPQYLIPQVPFQSLNVTNDFKLGSGDNHALLKYDAANNAVYVVKQDGSPVNFYSTGGISMYGLGDTSVTSLMDAIVNNLDPATLTVKNGMITVIGNTGSEGVSESVVRSIIESYGYIDDAELLAKDYADKDWVKEYVVDINTGNITAITKQMVIEALGYTPYSAANPNGYITSATLSGYATKNDLSGYLPISSYTASDILTKLKTVDGANSGLDADWLGGNSYKAFAIYMAGSSYINFSIIDKDLQAKGQGDGYIEYYDNGGWYNSMWGKVTARNGFVGALTGNADSANYSRSLAASSGDITTQNTSGYINYHVIPFDNAGSLPVKSNANGVLTLNTHTGNYHHQLGFSSNGRLYHRSFHNSKITLDGAWNEIAFITDTVASADKLSDNTAYTAWGQTFFENGKPKSASGNLTLGYYNILGGSGRSILTSNEGGYIELGSETSQEGQPTYINGNSVYLRYGTSKTTGFVLNSSGNVGVGTPSPAYKLDVNGNIGVSGQIFNSDGLSYLSMGVSSNRRYINLGDTNPSYNTIVNIDANTGTQFVGANNTVLAYLDHTKGNFGIGSSFSPTGTRPSYKLHVEGDIYSTTKVIVNGISLSKSQDDVLYLDGNLVVRGAITMYGTDSTTAPSIIDSLPIASTSSKGIAQFDSSYFTVDSSGLVTLLPDNVGLNETKLASYLTSNGYTTTTAVDTKLSGYLPLSGGTLTDRITISSSADEKIVLNNTDADTNYSWISWQQNGALIGRLGIPIGGTGLTWNGYQLIHAGNIASQSVAYATNAGNADTLDGHDSSYYKPLFQHDATTLNSSHNLNDYQKGYYSYINGNNPTNSFGNNAALLAFKSNRANDLWQIAFDGNNASISPIVAIRGNFAGTGWSTWKTIAFTDSNVASADYANKAGYTTKTFTENINYDFQASELKLISCANSSWQDNGFPRMYTGGLSAISDYVGWQMVVYGGASIVNPYFRKVDDKGAYSYWYQIAFTSDNVASATKLQTARTIWGQSFDGSGDVSGSLSNVGSISFLQDSSYDIGSSVAQARYIYTSWIGSKTGATFKLGANNDYHMYFSTSGNVGVGIASPNFKFDVYGTLNATTIYQNGTALGSMALKSSLVASDIPSLDWSKITSGKPTTLNGYGITNAYTASEVDTKLSGYLPLTGGTIKGSIRLKTDSSNYGQTIYFGDQSYCYISEPIDDAMKIYASKGVTIDATLSVTGTITGNLNGNATKDGDGNIITSTYLKASSYTASDILTKLKTVDGANSGLDADYLGGNTYKAFAIYMAGSSYINFTIIDTDLQAKGQGDGYIEYYDNGGWYNSKWGKVTAHNGFVGALTGNADSATQLKNSRTIWGQSFNGTGNVSGAFSGATTGSFSSNVTIGGTLAVTGTSTFTGKTTHNGGLGATTGTFSSTLAVTSTSVLSGGVTVGKTTAANGTYKLNVTGKSLLSGDTTIDGNLLVKGGITMYGTDGSSTDFLLDATSWSSVTSTSTTQVYTARATSLLTNKLSLVNLSVTSLNSSVTTLNNKIAAIKNALEGISSSSSASAIGAALNTLYNSL